jgi:hypothetical protein
MGSLGAANVQTKSPVASVVMVDPENVPSEHEVGVWRTELNRRLAVDDTLNPDPVTTYAAPIGPWVGVTVIAGVVIVNVAVPLSAPPSDPVAVTVYGVPDAVPEIVTVQLNVPVPDVVAPHALIVAPPLIVVVIVTAWVNPVPATTTDAPLGPCVGVSVMGGSPGGEAAITNPEEVNATGEESVEGEAPDGAWRPPDDAEVTLGEPAAELGEEIATVGDELGTPSVVPEAAPTPMEANADAPSMRIDTTRTRPMARRPGNGERAFIAFLNN